MRERESGGEQLREERAEQHRRHTIQEALLIKAQVRLLSLSESLARARSRWLARLLARSASSHDMRQPLDMSQQTAVAAMTCLMS
jgi:hypothetical protein